MQNPTIVCYEQAAAYLAKGRDKWHRPLHGKATSLVRTARGDIAVRYHETDIVTFHDDGSATLAADGHYTRATMEKLDEYTPYRYGHDSAVWYVGVNGERYGFKDGIHVAEDGTVTGAMTEDEIAARRDLYASIKRYAKRYTDDAVRALLSPFTYGDCEDGELAQYIEMGYISQAIIYRAYEVCGRREAWARTDIERGNGADIRRHIRQYFYAGLRAGTFSGMVAARIRDEWPTYYGY